MIEHNWRLQIPSNDIMIFTKERSQPDISWKNIKLAVTFLTDSDPRADTGSCYHLL